MATETGPFKVEFRCHFDSLEQAYRVLPFLQSCLKRSVSWRGSLYGRALFKSGLILRTGQTNENGRITEYLTWKGPDVGGFCNIRREVGEVITNGIVDSKVMTILSGKTTLPDKDAIVRELARLGYESFMTWRGTDTYGYYQPMDIAIKLMTCEVLKYPLIVEFEKMAAGEAEAAKAEYKLYEFCRELNLWDYVFKEEPTQLLYEKTFSEEPKQ